MVFLTIKDCQMHDAGYMGEIEGGEEGSPSGVPPTRTRPDARRTDLTTTGCATKRRSRPR